MKTRTDFVSNSSSSSYVFSFNEKSFAGGAAEMVRLACSMCFADDKEKAESPGLDERNRTTFLYQLQHYELLYLGEFAVGRDRRTLRRAAKSPGEWDDFGFYKKKISQGCVDGRDEDHTVVVSETADEIVLEYDVKAPHGLTVLNDYMECHIRKPGWIRNGRGKSVNKKIADNVIKTVKMVNGMESPWRTGFESDIYRITQNTLDNTRALIKEGYEFDLEKWEDLDGLQARLDAGETVFAVTVADEGDGEGDTHIYSLNGRWLFEGLPMELICNECG